MDPLGFLGAHMHACAQGQWSSRPRICLQLVKIFMFLACRHDDKQPWVQVKARYHQPLWQHMVSPRASESLNQEDIWVDSVKLFPVPSLYTCHGCLGSPLSILKVLISADWGHVGQIYCWKILSWELPPHFQYQHCSQSFFLSCMASVYTDLMLMI